MANAFVPHVGFPLSDSMQGKSNRFLEAVAAGNPKSGEYFYDVILQLTEEVIDALLLQTVTIARISSVGQKIINVCASTSNKASSMLSAKIYKGAKLKEMEKVAAFWQGMIKNTSGTHDGLWYLATPIDASLAQALDEILNEKGDNAAFNPSDIEETARKYDQLITIIIDHFFMQPAQFVDIGMVTRKMLNLGVDGVKQAAHAVIHKVVKKLEPEPLGAYVDHTTRFYVKLP